MIFRLFLSFLSESTIVITLLSVDTSLRTFLIKHSHVIHVRSVLLKLSCSSDDWLTKMKDLFSYELKLRRKLQKNRTRLKMRGWKRRKILSWLNRLLLVEVRLSERLKHIEVNDEKFESDDEVCKWYVWKMGGGARSPLFTPNFGVANRRLGSRVQGGTSPA